MKRAFCILLLALFPACRFMKKARQYSSFGVGVGSGAGFAAQQAVVSAATARATGGCFSDCQFGTICNHETGYCERPPDPNTMIELLPLDAGVRPANLER